MSTACGEPETAAAPGGLAAAFCSLVAWAHGYMGLQGCGMASRSLAAVVARHVRSASVTLQTV